MSDRPGYLIIVTGSDDGTLELFSAHYTEDDAKTTRDRLGRFTKVHMIEVPETAGIVAAPERAEPVKAPSAPIAAVEPQPAPAPFKRTLNAAEFEEETRQLMENAQNGIFRDADAPLSEGGAIA